MLCWTGVPKFWIFLSYSPPAGCPKLQNPQTVNISIYHHFTISTTISILATIRWLPSSSPSPLPSWSTATRSVFYIYMIQYNIQLIYMIYISTVLEKYEQINSRRYHQSVTFIDKKYHQPHNSHFRRSLRIASIFSGSYRLQVLLAAFIFIIRDIPL